MMQQHLTPEMLNELSPEAKERLREWWKPSVFEKVVAYGKVFVVGDIKGRVLVALNHPLFPCEGLSYWQHECLPLLSIGQCIELLNAKSPDGHVLIEYCEDWFKKGPWFVDARTAMLQAHAPELIRALWDVAKEVLEVGE